MTIQEPAVLSTEQQSPTATGHQHNGGPRVVVDLLPGLRARVSLAVFMLPIAAAGAGLAWLTRPAPLSPFGWVITAVAGLTCAWQLTAAARDLITRHRDGQRPTYHHPDGSCL